MKPAAGRRSGSSGSGVKQDGEKKARPVPAQARPAAEESAEGGEPEDGGDDLTGAVLGAVQPLVQPLVKPKPRPWIPRVAGIACYLIGLLDIIYALFPAFRNTKPIRSV